MNSPFFFSVGKCTTWRGNEVDWLSMCDSVRKGPCFLYSSRLLHVADHRAKLSSTFKISQKTPALFSTPSTKRTSLRKKCPKNASFFQLFMENNDVFGFFFSGQTSKKSQDRRDEGWWEGGHGDIFLHQQRPPGCCTWDVWPQNPTWKSQEVSKWIVNGL